MCNNIFINIYIYVSNSGASCKMCDLPRKSEVWTEEKYADGFDLVVCWGVLHHTHDPYKGILALEFDEL